MTIDDYTIGGTGREHIRRMLCLRLAKKEKAPARSLSAKLTVVLSANSELAIP